MDKRTVVYCLLILYLLNFNKVCGGSTFKEPLSAQNGSILNKYYNGDNNTQINISSNVTNEYYLYDKKDDSKIDEVRSKAKKLQESQEKKIEELENLAKHLQTNLDKVVKSLSESVSKRANSDVEYPAFTGSSYVAIAAPEKIGNFNMSMDVKATEPVTDGIIMYCADSEPVEGFMSLAVRQGRLEFRFNNGWDSKIVVTADRTLPANEWTNIEVSRMDRVVSLRINSGAALEGKLGLIFLFIRPTTPIFIGGVDASIDPKNNIDVSGGYKGCIKHVTLNEVRKDNLVKDALRSANVQECSNGK